MIGRELRITAAPDDPPVWLLLVSNVCTMLAFGSFVYWLSGVFIVW